MCIAYVEEPGKVTIDRRGVTIRCQSGDQKHEFRMSRADYRAFLEVGIRQLNDYEAAERDNVVPLRGAG